MSKDVQLGCLGVGGVLEGNCHPSSYYLCVCRLLMVRWLVGNAISNSGKTMVIICRPTCVFICINLGSEI